VLRIYIISSCISRVPTLDSVTDTLKNPLVQHMHDGHIGYMAALIAISDLREQGTGLADVHHYQQLLKPNNSL